MFREKHKKNCDRDRLNRERKGKKKRLKKGDESGEMCCYDTMRSRIEIGMEKENGRWRSREQKKKVMPQGEKECREKSRFLEAKTEQPRSFSVIGRRRIHTYIHTLTTSKRKKKNTPPDIHLAARVCMSLKERG